MVDRTKPQLDAMCLSLASVASSFEELQHEFLNLSILLDSFEGDPGPVHWDHLSRIFVVIRDGLVMTSENLKDSLNSVDRLNHGYSYHVTEKAIAKVKSM